MSPDGSVLACALWAKQQQVSILCIQETHIPFDEDYEIGSGWRFINFASKDGIGGVGALLLLDASRRLVAATGTHRHIVLNLRILTIVGVYVPTAQSPEERESFFDTLRSQFTREALHNNNSRLNSKRMSRAALHAKAQFEDFLMASDLCVSGPSQPTFFSNNGTSATLDYVVCRKRFKSSVFSVRVKNNAPLKSDHCPVVAEIYLHFSKPEMIVVLQRWIHNLEHTRLHLH